jgi:hypothetical protein
MCVHLKGKRGRERRLCVCAHVYVCVYTLHNANAASNKTSRVDFRL